MFTKSANLEQRIVTLVNIDTKQNKSQSSSVYAFDILQTRLKKV